MSGELSHQSAPLFDEVLLVVQYNCGPANLLSDPQPQPQMACSNRMPLVEILGVAPIYSPHVKYLEDVLTTMDI